MASDFSFSSRSKSYHGSLATVAVVLSIIVHLGVLHFFADWIVSELTGSSRAGVEVPVGETVPPMRVDTMQLDPMQYSTKIAGERDLPSRGPIEAGENVATLSQPVDTTLLAPPPIPREALTPGIPNLKESTVQQVDTTPWMPRQEITQIFDRSVQDELAALPRREIPMIERIPQAPDIVPSIDLAGRRFGKGPEMPKPTEVAEVFDTDVFKGTFKAVEPDEPTIPAQMQLAATGERIGAKSGEKRGQGSAGSGDLNAPEESKPAKLSSEDSAARLSDSDKSYRDQSRSTQQEITALEESVDYIPIDDLLGAVLQTYRNPAEPGRVYFKISIMPREDKNLPVLPKDLLLVQDVSASITEERLSYCRRALVGALDSLSPHDRFSVVAFRDTFEMAFPDWIEASEENIIKAKHFVNGLRSYGQTDVFGSLKTLMQFKRNPRRPMIAFIVTDGKPTAGLTENAHIIGDFSALNNGLFSVYMYGTHKDANSYLLDLLSYCNRGKNLVISGNRWEIPATMATLYNGIKYPIMGDVTFAFDSASDGETYPRRTANLYKNVPLEVYGVCPDTTRELIFQIRGLADGKGYDSIFRLNMASHARAGNAIIQQNWISQKMFYLLGEYARSPDKRLLNEMLKLHQRYNIEIPYAGELE